MTATTTNQLTWLRVEQRLAVRACEDSPLWLWRREFPAGILDSVHFPKRFSNPFARLAHGRWCLSRASRDFELSAAGGAFYIEWTLAEGEEVCFHYDRLIAFSDTLALTTILNTQAAALYTLSPFYSVARGPGRLLFKVAGDPPTLEDPLDQPVVIPERLIAWSRDCLFEPIATPGILNFYFAQPSLKVVSAHRIVLDAHVPRGTETLAGDLWHYMKRLLRPW